MHWGLGMASPSSINKPGYIRHQKLWLEGFVSDSFTVQLTEYITKQEKECRGTYGYAIKSSNWNMTIDCNDYDLIPAEFQVGSRAFGD